MIAGKKKKNKKSLRFRHRIGNIIFSKAARVEERSDQAVKTLVLSKEDSKAFWEALENPPPLSDRLKVAAKLYREAFPSAENRGIA